MTASFTNFEVYFETFRLLISSMSSRIIPLLLVSNYRILSSFILSCIFPSDICNINSFLVASTSGISFIITSASSYSSKPRVVTVKLITVTLIKISGKKLGLAALVWIKSLKFGSISNSESPIFMIFLFEII